MILLQNTSVMNFEHALRGARNPKNSWARMDSYTRADGTFVLGPNDCALAQRPIPPAPCIVYMPVPSH